MHQNIRRRVLHFHPMTRFGTARHKPAFIDRNQIMVEIARDDLAGDLLWPSRGESHGRELHVDDHLF